MAASMRELTAGLVAVATAKLTEYRRQCWRLAALVCTGTLDRVTAVDTLCAIAIAHGLVSAHGEERIEAIVAEAFAGSDFNPIYASEAAA
jgi:hypothetical protein